MPSFIIPSFAKGELAPALHGRVDLAAYQVGLRTARNLIVHPSGGASNRPGTVFIGPCGVHTAAPRLFDFQFRTSDQYVLEFGALYMRVIRNDGHVLNAAVTITAATQASPVVVTATSHGFSNGDEVFITGVVGMTQLNGNRYRVANVAANTMELTHQGYQNTRDANLDGTDFTAYASAGTVATVFQLTTPYLQADLANLKIVQSGDVMTITHRTYAPRDLARTDHNAWTLTVNTYAPGQADPTGVSVAQQGTSGSTIHRYRVTAIRREEDVFEESLPGLNSTTRTITGATAANPVVITSNGHGYANGDEVEIAGIVGMTEINGRRFNVANQATNTFELEGENGSSHTAYSSGGTANATFVELTNSITVALTVLADFNRISWTAATGAGRYAIYRRESGRYGLIAEVDAPIVTFDDVTTAVTAAGAIHAVDLTVGPPRARNPFLLSGDFPGASSYYQQRQVYGGTTDNPDTKYYSQTGNRLNMSVSTPTQADDALTVTLNARQVNEIRHFVPLTDLLVLTSGAEWRINSGDNSGFSATTLFQKPQSEWGSSHHRPIVSGETVLFVPDGSTQVRGLDYNLEKDKYIGSDLMRLASHLLAEEGVSDFTVSDWAYASNPENRLYIARSDGQALAMTYDRVEQVVAWTRWDTLGSFERMISLRRSVSGVEDGVYFVVQRTINGNTVRFIERLSTRKFSDVRDAFFVDCGLTLDSPVAITGATAANPVVVTATAHGFSNDDLVDIEGITWAFTYDAEFNEVQPDQLNDRRFVVAGATSNTFDLVEEKVRNITGATVANPVVVTSPEHGFADGEIVHISGVIGMTQLNGSSFTVAEGATDTFELQSTDGSAYGTWTGGGLARRQVDGTAFSAYSSGGNVRQAITSLTGLEHLEAEDVQILADGSPLPPVTIAAASTASPTTVVVNGALTLGTAASRVHVGLRYVADWETLNVESTEGTVQGELSKISEVVVRFYKSRLPLVGPHSGNLTQMKQRELERLGSPTALLTGDKKVTLPPDWNSNGRIFFRQPLPLPTTILAVVPDMEFADRG